MDRVELEPTTDPISRVTPVQLTVNVAVDRPDFDAILLGGFTQSPVFVAVEANSSGEKIESVSLVVDGETSDELTLTEPSYGNVYNFQWVPMKREYTVSAIMRDVAGNVISTSQSNFRSKIISVVGSIYPPGR